MIMSSKRIQNKKIIGDGNIVGDNSTSRVVKQETFIGNISGAVHTGSGSIQVSNSPSKDDILRLNKFADYLYETPSRISERSILEIEGFLASFYKKAVRNKWDRQVISNIKKALSLSAYLSFSIRTGDSREPRYFDGLLNLRGQIDKINYLLEELFR